VCILAPSATHFEPLGYQLGHSCLPRGVEDKNQQRPAPGLLGGLYANLIQRATNAATAALRRYDQAAQKTDWRGRVVRKDSAQANGIRHLIDHVVDGKPGGPDDLIVRNSDPVPSGPVVGIDHVVRRELNGHLDTPTTQAQADDRIETSPLGNWVKLSYRPGHFAPLLPGSRHCLPTPLAEM
jgi:hypothetical protein